jgi:prophage tail gpP-like protein
MYDDLINKKPDEMTLYIGDMEIIIDNAKFLRTMDTCVDALTVVMPWSPGDNPKLDDVTDHNSFSESLFYIGGSFQMRGVLYDVTHKRSSGGTIKELHMFTPTADIVDSTMIPPYEANNISLVDRCKQLCGPFGIPIVVGDGVNLKVPVKKYKKVAYYDNFTPDKIFGFTNPWRTKFALDNIDVDALTFKKYKLVGDGYKQEIEKFSRVVAKQTDTIFKHLHNLAAQRGFLLSCTKYGELIITKANVNAEPIGTIVETEPTAEVYEANFKGRKRFRLYRVLTSSSRADTTGAAATAQDLAIEAPRMITKNADNNLPGECKNAAEWLKNLSAAEAMTFSFPVNSWYAPNGKLWEPNTTINVVSPTLDVADGFIFLITRVEFSYDSGGATATLSLKPPSAYTLGDITEP